jgi:hypothetical protein
MALIAAFCQDTVLNGDAGFWGHKMRLSMGELMVELDGVVVKPRRSFEPLQ